MKIHEFSQKDVSCILVGTLLLTALSGCGSTANSETAVSLEKETVETTALERFSESDESETDTDMQEEFGSSESDKEQLEQFITDKFYKELSVCYDVFDASIKLEDGTEIQGIGYSDFSAFLESDDGGKGLFPAGFIMTEDAPVISDAEKEKGLIVNNLDYEDSNYGFLYTDSMDSFYEHCVADGKYVKYGIDGEGRFVYTCDDYQEEIVDTSLGALYSYDDDEYLYDLNVGEYVNVTGESLYQTIDYDELEQEVNRILEEQDFNFSSVDIETTVYVAQEAVNAYILSLQEETFMGCNATELAEEVSKLDPMQCIRITPEGHVVVDIEDDLPQEPTTAAKWIVGMSCGIAVAGSIALGVFVPAATPASGAISGAAIDAFMQVVLENNAVENINWSKVAISATSGAILAWACPMGAATVAKSVGKTTGNEVLSELSGLGFLTFGNGVVSGATNAAYTVIDGKDDVWDSFLTGATVGAVCTAMTVGVGKLAQAGMSVLKESHPENWFVKLTEKTSTFIEGHQYHLSNDDVESILRPKSVYEASKAGVREWGEQKILQEEPRGGSYNALKKLKNSKLNNSEIKTEVHETPAFSATGADERGDGPSIRMIKEDHAKTASYGNSKEAREYQKAQKMLIEQGNYHDAIQMDITDIQSKFGDKYDDAIEEMLEYATQIGWW